MNAMFQIIYYVANNSDYRQCLSLLAYSLLKI